MRVLVKRWLSTDAVSEVLGSMLLVLMAVAMFSIIYSMVYSMTPGPSPPQATLAFSVGVGNITITHRGGEPLDQSTEIIYIIDDQTTVTTIGDDYTSWDIDGDGRFEFGEKLVYRCDNVIRKNVTVQVVDPISDSIIMMSRVNREYILPPEVDTNVIPIRPYNQGNPTFKITASGDYRLDAVSLYYRYSSDNTTWSPYIYFGNDTVYPWNWSFNFDHLNGTGYYEFYSIGWYSRSSESPPSEADARCYCSHSPIISNPDPPDGAVDVPLNPTLHITVSDADGDKMNITWYKKVGRRWEVIGVNHSVGDGTYSTPTSCFDEYSTTYYWMVTVDDGLFN
ncbi:MAG TPA: type IV pilin, partial [Thermoplasmatales archaeon]|nr:type IV pilin [Thermoplasmatales archaeon]